MNIAKEFENIKKGHAKLFAKINIVNCFQLGTRNKDLFILFKESDIQRDMRIFRNI